MSSSSFLESAGSWFVGLSDTLTFSLFPTHILNVFTAGFKVLNVHLQICFVAFIKNKSCTGPKIV